MEDIVGIDKYSFHVVSGSSIPEAKDKFASLRALIIRTAMGEPIEASVLKASLYQSSWPEYFKKSNTDRDVRDFHDNALPVNEFELAAKIAAQYFSKLDISEKEISEIIIEYLKSSKKNIISLDDAFVKALMQTPLDNKKYSLHTIFPENDQGATIKYALIKVKEKLDSEVKQSCSQQQVSTGAVNNNSNAFFANSQNDDDNVVPLLQHWCNIL